MPAFKDLTGNKYNRLEVLYRVENINGLVAYMCRCDCGVEKVIVGKNLTNNNTKSCGCLNREMIKKPKYNRSHKYIEKEDYIIAINNKEKEFKFDKDDFKKVDKYYWNLDGQGYFTVRRKQEDGSFLNLKLHRYIMNVTETNIEVDHINGDPSDNRKSNLRLVTKGQNQMNYDKRINNKSGTRGVAYLDSRSTWTSYIQKDGTRYNFGYFQNKQDAIDIREEFEHLIFGEYSRKHEYLKEKFKHIEDFDAYIKNKYPKLYAKYEKAEKNKTK